MRALCRLFLDSQHSIFPWGVKVVENSPSELHSLPELPRCCAMQQVSQAYLSGWVHIIINIEPIVFIVQLELKSTSVF